MSWQHDWRWWLPGDFGVRQMTLLVLWSMDPGESDCRPSHSAVINNLISSREVAELIESRIHLAEYIYYGTPVVENLAKFTPVFETVKAYKSIWNMQAEFIMFDSVSVTQDQIIRARNMDLWRVAAVLLCLVELGGLRSFRWPGWFRDVGTRPRPERMGMGDFGWFTGLTFFASRKGSSFSRMEPLEVTEKLKAGGDGSLHYGHDDPHPLSRPSVPYRTALYLFPSNL